MGDRGNIRILYGGGKEIWFYTHWRGTELPKILQTALKRGKGRWGDESYLSRIIFCEMVKGEEMGETGFGISPTIDNNENDVLTVNCPKQTVEWTVDNGNKPGKAIKIPFKEFALNSNSRLRRKL